MIIFDYQNPQNNFQDTSAQVGRMVGFDDIPKKYLREKKALLPNLSELEVVRHYTKISQKNFSIDTHFYPLGSCTMKYNPKVGNSLAMLENFICRHPLSPDETGQGLLSCLFELQNILSKIAGMSSTSLAPMAGAQAEFAGIAMIRAFHLSKGDTTRDTIIIPAAAHGTNPATAAICGYKIIEIPCLANGNIDLAKLQEVCNQKIAGLMLTNPSTLGVFESNILEVSRLVHDCGGLLYYDGANLNAILGMVKPGDMGFDVMHMNLHKTFSTPHGGGGPGVGTLSCVSQLVPFLPIPLVIEKEENNLPIYQLTTRDDCPQSIGRLSAFSGNIGILLRAYVYLKMLGGNNLQKIAERATLNANYLMAKMQAAGFECAYPNRRASHEFIVTLKNIKQSTGVGAMDFAKRLLDKGFHAPTTYFPQIISECLLIEPTETETKQSLDNFVLACIEILKEAKTNPQLVKTAPHNLTVSRVDEVKAVKEIDIKYQFK